MIIDETGNKKRPQLFIAHFKTVADPTNPCGGWCLGCQTALDDGAHRDACVDDRWIKKKWALPGLRSRIANMEPASEVDGRDDSLFISRMNIYCGAESIRTPPLRSIEA